MAAYSLSYSQHLTKDNLSLPLRFIFSISITYSNIYFLQGNDAFTVDVSNGFNTVEGLQISVTIVPRIIPIQAFNFTVKEGLSRAINAEIINISHPFYSSANIEFTVEVPPQHGDIRYLDGEELSYFTWEAVCSAMMKDIHTL